MADENDKNTQSDDHKGLLDTIAKLVSGKKDEKPKDGDKTEVEKIKVQVDGKEVEVGLKEIVEGWQKSSSADRKQEEASEVQKMLQKVQQAHSVVRSDQATLAQVMKAYEIIWAFQGDDEDAIRRQSVQILSENGINPADPKFDQMLQTKIADLLDDGSGDSNKDGDEQGLNMDALKNMAMHQQATQQQMADLYETQLSQLVASQLQADEGFKKFLGDEKTRDARAENFKRDLTNEAKRILRSQARTNGGQVSLQDFPEAVRKASKAVVESASKVIGDPASLGRATETAGGATGGYRAKVDAFMKSAPKELTPEMVKTKGKELDDWVTATMLAPSSGTSEEDSL